MRCLSKIIVFFLFTIIAFGDVAGGAPAFAEEKPSYAHLPPVGGLMLRQMGSDLLLVELRARPLPFEVGDCTPTRYLYTERRLPALRQVAEGFQPALAGVARSSSRARR